MRTLVVLLVVFSVLFLKELKLYLVYFVVVFEGFWSDFKFSFTAGA